MPRKPKFDRDEVVARAMEVFWADGYSNATLQTLGEAMGLQPGSIYGAFGSKDGLFREALQAYVGAIRRRLGADLGGREVLRLWFEQHVERATAIPGGRGCLLLNSAAESRALDEESAELVRSELAVLNRFFTSLIDQVRGAGVTSEDGSSSEDGSPSEDSATLANTLVATLCGISVMSRAGIDRASLLAIARQALAAV